MSTSERIISAIDNQIDRRLPQSEEAIRRRRNRILRPAAALALAGTVVFGAKVTHEAVAMPEFSETTTTHVMYPGEGIYDAVQDIDGIQSIDMRDAADYVKDLPANQEVLEDGLQAGEPLVIPTSIKH